MLRIQVDNSASSLGFNIFVHILEVVVVGGKDEGNVCDCVDKLRAMEEDYITELIDRGAYSTRKEEPKREVVNAFRTPFIINRD